MADQREYPNAPAAPNSPPSGYVAPSGAQAGQEPPKTAGQLDLFRGNFLEMLLRKVVEAVNGVFVYGLGGAFEQLSSWATTLWNAAEDAMNMLRRLLERVGGTIFGTIEDAVDFVGDAITGTANTLGNLMNQLLTNAGAVIGNIPQALVSGLTGAIGAINNAIGAASSFIQGVIDAIVGGLRGIPIIGALIPDLSKSVKQQKADQQNFTISAIISDARNPEHVCRYPISDVTYPEFINNHLSVFGTTDNASAGTAHVHDLNIVDNVTATPGGWSVNQYESRGSYLTIANTTVHDTIGAIVWKDAGTLDNVYLELFKENADLSLTQIMSREFSASITTSAQFFEFTLPSRLVVQSGERFLLRIRNSSSVATTARLLGVQRITSSVDSGFKTVGSSLTAQTSYTTAEAATARTAGVTLNWFMLAAKNMPSIDRYFSDDANRSAIGGMWVCQSSTASLLDIYEEAFGYTGTTDGDQAALYIHRCSRDVNRVSANLHLNTASTARCGLLMHCSRDLSQVVYLGVNSTSAKIYSGPIDSLTERASLASGGTAEWAMYYDAAADKYVALKDNGITGLEWTSPTAIRDADHRFGGFRISMASAEAAGTVDNWILRDWYISVPFSALASPMTATAAMPDAVVSSAVTIPADRMASTAAMSDADLAVELNIPADRMASTAAGSDTDVSDGTRFPYGFDFELG